MVRLTAILKKKVLNFWNNTLLPFFYYILYYFSCLYGFIKLIFSFILKFFKKKDKTERFADRLRDLYRGRMKKLFKVCNIWIYILSYEFFCLYIVWTKKRWEKSFFGKFDVIFINLLLLLLLLKIFLPINIFDDMQQTLWNFISFNSSKNNHSFVSVEEEIEKYQDYVYSETAKNYERGFGQLYKKYLELKINKNSPVSVNLESLPINNDYVYVTEKSQKPTRFFWDLTDYEVNNLVIEKEEDIKHLKKIQINADD